MYADFDLFMRLALLHFRNAARWARTAGAFLAVTSASLALAAPSGPTFSGSPSEVLQLVSGRLLEGLQTEPCAKASQRPPKAAEVASCVQLPLVKQDKIWVAQSPMLHITKKMQALALKEGGWLRSGEGRATQAWLNLPGYGWRLLQVNRMPPQGKEKFDVITIALYDEKNAPKP